MQQQRLYQNSPESVESVLGVCGKKTVVNARHASKYHVYLLVHKTCNIVMNILAVIGAKRSLEGLTSTTSNACKCDHILHDVDVGE